MSRRRAALVDAQHCVANGGEALEYVNLRGTACSDGQSGRDVYLGCAASSEPLIRDVVELVGALLPPR